MDRTDLNQYMNLEDVNVNQILGASPIKGETVPMWTKIVSNIFHPVLMPTYMLCFLFLYSNSGGLFGFQYVILPIFVFMLSCMIPLSGVFFLKQLRLISSYELKKKGEVYLPVFISILSNLALVYYFWVWIGSMRIFFLWYLALLTVPIILQIIYVVFVSCKRNISGHMLGIGALIGGVLSICANVKAINLYFLFMILFILAGLLGTARLIQKKSTEAQIYIGFLIGLIVTYSMVWASVKYAIPFLKMII